MIARHEQRTITRQEAAEWVDALESGRWKQCSPSLGDGESEACAAGVYLFERLENLPAREWIFAMAFNDLFRYDFHQIADILRQRYQIDRAL